MTRVRGMANLNRKLADLAAGMHRGASEGRAEATEDVAEDWRREAPVDTGEHRAGIVATDEGAAATAEHSPYVEYGTRTHRAHGDGRAAAARAAVSMPATVARNVKRRLPR